MQNGYENYTKEELISTVILLKDELAQLKRMLFGSKSERFVPSNLSQQSILFTGKPPAKYVLCMLV